MAESKVEVLGERLLAAEKVLDRAREEVSAAKSLLLEEIAHPLRELDIVEIEERAGWGNSARVEIRRVWVDKIFYCRSRSGGVFRPQKWCPRVAFRRHAI